MLIHPLSVLNLKVSNEVVFRSIATCAGTLVLGGGGGSGATLPPLNSMCRKVIASSFIIEKLLLTCSKQTAAQ